jgi:type IV pilus assembly protein PilB
MAAVETAISRESSVPAAQAGHVGVPTLPTDDAPTTRMCNMGIAPSNIASSVIPTTAPRLARRLYSDREAPIEVSGKTMRDGSWISYRPVARSACNNGYQERVGTHQVMPVTEELRRSILRAGLAPTVGVRSLRQSGLHQVEMGLTSLEEVIAVTNE